MTITLPFRPTPTEATAAEDLVRIFSGATHVGSLVDIRSFAELVRRYEQNQQKGFYYAPDTMRFFGTRNPHLAAPGVTVECQTKAPEGMPKYSITAWVRMPNGDIRPTSIGRRDTLGAARRYARAVYTVWTDTMKQL